MEVNCCARFVFIFIKDFFVFEHTEVYPYPVCWSTPGQSLMQHVNGVLCFFSIGDSREQPDVPLLPVFAFDLQLSYQDHFLMRSFAAGIEYGDVGAVAQAAAWCPAHFVHACFHSFLFEGADQFALQVIYTELNVL